MEPGYYAPRFTKADQEYEDAWEKEFDAIRYAAKDLKNAKAFGKEYLDDDDVALILTTWANGGNLIGIINGIVDKTAKFNVERTFL